MSSNNEVELKGGMYTFMSLKLRTRDLDSIDHHLANKVQQAPGFFKDTPVVLDLRELDDQSDEQIAQVIECVRKHQLKPIVASVGNKSSPLALAIELPLIESHARRKGSIESPAETAPDDASRKASDAASNSSTGAPPRNSPDAQEAGVSLHMGAAKRGKQADAGSVTNGSAKEPSGDASGDPEDVSIEALEVTPGEVEYVVKAPQLITRPVRSGQQIYARDTDLIVMGPVGPGAEVIADNNIHVYGPLRGRALCGVSGNTETRIFCQSLEAELVSVAGNFRLLENIPEDLRGKPAQIWLDNERLTIEPL